MFTLTPNKFASKDQDGRVRHIEHIREPYLSQFLDEPDAEQLADEYLSETATVYQIEDGLMKDLTAKVPDGLTAANAQLHRSAVKEIAGSVIVNYAQTYQGLPVWGADFSVHIASAPIRVTSSTSSLHPAIKLGNDPKAAADELENNKYTPQSVSKLLGLKKGKKVSKINGVRLMIYQFDPEQRIEQCVPSEENVDCAFETPLTMPALPELGDEIKPGMHYVVAEVLFDLGVKGMPDLHWRAFIEPVTGSVLYVRALIAAVTGKVFRMDPISLSGNAGLTPGAAEASLNAYRSNIALTDLTVSNPQQLDGNWVDLHEIEAPVEGDPSEPPPFQFSYDVKTTDFAAVNAYYHVNWFFRLIQGMGFDLNAYFDNTSFPVQVDHWSLGGSASVNAHCPGNAAGNGIGHFCFASAQAGETVGIANDVRVVIHEFGHALLWDHVNSPNFGFAHSAGDGLGAILMDPTSKAPDRFLTFPWPQIGTGPLDRRQDRKVADGWGWFGNRYNTQYNGEQVLSTTLFRIYRSAGGDSPHLADRRWAARYVAYLIIKAIGTLTTTTNDPEVFVTALMNADLTTTDFEGHPGGALHKVIRWAFEKQGLFQPNAKPGLPPGTPKVTTEGDPPDVDVYIDDGRNGEYPYLYSFWDSNDMWVRRRPDGGTTHQHPALGRTNYMYVRVKNRGTQAANNVTVKAYHCKPGTGLAWPHHWSPMDTPMLPAAGAIPSGGDTIVGPFRWKPTVFGHECLLAIASADGDPGNDTTVLGSIPHSRFVPFDNNIGQRNVHPLFVPHWPRIWKYLRRIPFYVVNPYRKAVKVELVAVLPKIMKKNKIWIFFTSRGGNKFELGPYQRRKVLFNVVNINRLPSRRPWEKRPLEPKPGVLSVEDHCREDDVDDGDDLARIRRPIRFRIITLINGQNMGGMTYELLPSKRIRRLPTDLDDEQIEGDIYDTDRLLDDLRAKPGIKDVQVCKVNLDVEFDDDQSS